MLDGVGAQGGLSSRNTRLGRRICVRFILVRAVACDLHSAAPLTTVDLASNGRRIRATLEEGGISCGNTFRPMHRSSFAGRMHSGHCGWLRGRLRSSCLRRVYAARSRQNRGLGLEDGNGGSDLAATARRPGSVRTAEADLECVPGRSALIANWIRMRMRSWFLSVHSVPLGRTLIYGRAGRIPGAVLGKENFPRDSALLSRAKRF